MSWRVQDEQIGFAGGLSRRRFLFMLPMVTGGWLSRRGWAQGATGVHVSVLEFDRARILAGAAEYVGRPPISLAAAAHEAGSTRPLELTSPPVEMFGAETHRDAAPSLAQTDLLREMVRRIAALTAAWRLTQEQHYLDAALQQLRTWCIAPETRMEPTLEQVGTLGTPADDSRINGLNQTVCLAELARAAAFVCAAPQVSADDSAALRGWCASLLTWFNESKRGVVAREAKDLQPICWTMQAAELARFTRNDSIFRECTHRFRDRLLRQMTFDGYFAPALQSRRPYAASMFTLECLASACESLSTPFENQWNYTLPDGRGMRSAVAWAYPYLASKGKWPYVSDAHLFGEQPLRINAILFAARAWNRPDYLDLWKTMRPDTGNVELQREQPITQPGLWAMRPPA